MLFGHWLMDGGLRGTHWFIISPIIKNACVIVCIFSQKNYPLSPTSLVSFGEVFSLWICTDLCLLEFSLNSFILRFPNISSIFFREVCPLDVLLLLSLENDWLDVDVNDRFCWTGVTRHTRCCTHHSNNFIAEIFLFSTLHTVVFFRGPLKWIHILVYRCF